MTQRSLLRDRDDYTLDETRREKAYGGDIATDWTVDISDFETQIRDRQKRREDAEKLKREPILEDNDAMTYQPAGSEEKRPLYGNHRVMSDVLSNRVNESSGRNLSRHRHTNANDTLSTDRHQNKAERRIASAQNASRADDKAAVHGALDQPAARRPRTVSRVNRPVSSGSEAPAIDLVQDRFSRLGGLSTDRSVLGNTSRCTLPADRLAAARARLEHKKMERRKAGGDGRDKENVRP
jgi:hypothetical protein